MAKKLTSKTPLFGNRRSHALNATKHAQKPNLQKITLANGQAVRVSTRELRTLNKVSKKAKKAATESK
jgi:large subunit ribosomal protein L28